MAADAFTQAIEKRLELLANDEYRKTARTMLLDPANRQFAEGWLRQEEFDRKFGAYNQWQADWTKTLNTAKSAKESAEAAVAAAQARIAELEAGITSPGTGAAPVVPDAHLKGVQDQIARLENVITQQKDAIEKMVDERIRGAAGYVFNHVYGHDDVQTRHQAEFGRRMTAEERTKVLEFQGTNNVGIGDAWEKVFSTEREAIKEKKIREDERAKAIAEYEASRSTNGIPTSDGSGPGLGAVQQMYRRPAAEQNNGLPPEASLNDAALAAAAELRREGRF